MMSDPVMSGFLFMKALIARYGVDQTAQLTTMANRLVADGTFSNRRAAIKAIEEQMGLPATTPLSEEAADYTTRRR